jgi:CBS domain-containing protein
MAKVKKKVPKTVRGVRTTSKKVAKKTVKHVAKKVVAKKSVVKKVQKIVKIAKAPLIVEDFEFSKIITVDQSLPIIEVAKLMTQNKIGAVVVLSPILDAIGIFTERDLMNRVVSKGLDLKRPVFDVMTPNFECVQLHDEMKDIPKIMVNGNFRHLPVVDGRKVIGMISIRDLVRILLHHGKPG